ncbi:RRQRL motif-containing zinc-binding protein [Streptomyces sp. NPDC052069]|uniref:RRQRL motif-containing zinc-binding protein n=1 Tax=Streptomyces sp. NPDC052069 TaxID=3154650 RepID=UPI00342F1836
MGNHHHRQDHGLVDVDPYAPEPSGTIPTYDWRASPPGLATRRQLRARGLRPGGHDPVAQLRCRHCLTRPARVCTRMAYLYRLDLALPVRPMTLAKEAALDRAMAQRSTCPLCRRRYHHCLPLRSIGSCLECAEGTPADPTSYIAPPAGHPAAA